MNALYSAHSGLRYLVVLVGIVAILFFAFGLVTKRPAGKAVRAVGSSFAGLLDLQIVLGLLLVVMGRYYPALIGHIAMMVLAAVVLHVLLVVNRKRPTPGYALPLLGAVLAFALIYGGIAAIGRGLFGHVPFAG